MEQLPDAAAPVDTPSLLDDPAGAISRMLTLGERRADLLHDLSPWGMFMAADLVVKAVMIGLPDKPIYLTLKTDLTLSLGNDPVARATLAVELDRQSENNKNTRIFLRADKSADYGEFMLVMNLLRDAGYLKIALVGVETLPQPIVATGDAGVKADTGARPGRTGGAP